MYDAILQSDDQSAQSGGTSESGSAALGDLMESLPPPSPQHSNGQAEPGGDGQPEVGGDGQDEAGHGGQGEVVGAPYDDLSDTDEGDVDAHVDGG